MSQLAAAPQEQLDLRLKLTLEVREQSVAVQLKERLDIPQLPQHKISNLNWPAMNFHDFSLSVIFYHQPLLPF
jgi:hypothetical protein